MTPEVQRIIRSFSGADDYQFAKARRRLLDWFGTEDGVALGIELLRDAIAIEDAGDVEWSLTVCGVFGFTDDHLEYLVALASADWQRSHETVVSILGMYRSPEVLEILYDATQFVPEYLEHDEGRALAREAIWRIGAIPGAEADAVLDRLREIPHELLRSTVAERIERRRADAELRQSDEPG